MLEIAASLKPRIYASSFKEKQPTLGRCIRDYTVLEMREPGVNTASKENSKSTNVYGIKELHYKERQLYSTELEKSNKTLLDDSFHAHWSHAI